MIVRAMMTMRFDIELAMTRFVDEFLEYLGNNQAEVVARWNVGKR